MSWAAHWDCGLSDAHSEYPHSIGVREAQELRAGPIGLALDFFTESSATGNSGACEGPGSLLLVVRLLDT